MIITLRDDVEPLRGVCLVISYEKRQNEKRTWGSCDFSAQRVRLFSACLFARTTVMWRGGKRFHSGRAVVIGARWRRVFCNWLNTTVSDGHFIGLNESNNKELHVIQYRTRKARCLRAPGHRPASKFRRQHTPSNNCYYCILYAYILSNARHCWVIHSEIRSDVDEKYIVILSYEIKAAIGVVSAARSETTTMISAKREVLYTCRTTARLGSKIFFAL